MQLTWVGVIHQQMQYVNNRIPHRWILSKATDNKLTRLPAANQQKTDPGGMAL
jgi:hypothetical protein